MTRRKPLPPIPSIEESGEELEYRSDEEIKELLAIGTSEAVTLDAPPDHPSELQAIAGNYCPNCEQKIRTDLNNQPICPIALTHCPRNTTP